MEEFQNMTKEIVFKQERLEEGWIELRDQISRCTLTDKVKMKNKIIGQKFSWDKECS